MYLIHIYGHRFTLDHITARKMTRYQHLVYRHRMRQNRKLLAHFRECEQRGLCVTARTQSEALSLRRRSQDGELLCPFPKLYARPDYWNALSYHHRGWHVIRTVGGLHPNWVFCHVTAAWALGFTESYRFMKNLHTVTCRESHARDRGHVIHHYIRRGIDDDYINIGGIRTTNLMRTAFDCARFLLLTESLPILDMLLRISGEPTATLLEYAGGMRLHQYWKRGMLALNLADGRAESGGESLARTLIYLLGFVIPELQVEIEDPVTGKRYRVDFLWVRPDRIRIVGEFNGKQKYTDPAMTHGRTVGELLDEERKRMSRLSAYDLRIMSFGYEDLRDPQRFARLLDTFGVPRRHSASQPASSAA